MIDPEEAAATSRASFARSLAAFLALPGVIAFGVPVAWIAAKEGFRMRQPLGVAILAVGIAGLLWCVREFHIVGGGSIAPWGPPKELVDIGLFRWSRNPIYLSVMVILAGWAVTFASWVLALYAAAIALAFHLRVVWGEEPWLARTHGERWLRYAARVPRWLGRARGDGEAPGTGR